jgi:hypothetical protein
MSDILNSVLIGILIGIILILVFNIFKNNNSNETMRETSTKPIVQPLRQCGFAQLLNTPPKYSDDQLNPDFENNKLQRDIVIGQFNQRPILESKFENTDIQKYQDEFLSVEDKLNNSSRNFVSSVDKLNEYFVTDNNELGILKGETIADIYDNLQKKEVDKFKQCKNPNCVLPSDYDDILQRNIYKDNEKTTLTNYDVMYEFDDVNVNNGGKFDGYVMGNDVNQTQTQALF